MYCTGGGAGLKPLRKLSKGCTKGAHGYASIVLLFLFFRHAADVPFFCRVAGAMSLLSRDHLAVSGISIVHFPLSAPVPVSSSPVCPSPVVVTVVVAMVL